MAQRLGVQLQALEVRGREGLTGRSEPPHAGGPALSWYSMTLFLMGTERGSQTSLCRTGFRRCMALAIFRTLAA